MVFCLPVEFELFFHSSARSMGNGVGGMGSVMLYRVEEMSYPCVGNGLQQGTPRE